MLVKFIYIEKFTRKNLQYFGFIIVLDFSAPPPSKKIDEKLAQNYELY